jgi:hypothetical protein
VNTSAISRQSATWQVARVLGLVIVLCLSAALGLVVGSALKGDQPSGAQATVQGGSGAPAYADPYREYANAARGGVVTGAPAYADPYREYANAAAAAADDATAGSATRPTPR